MDDLQTKTYTVDQVSKITGSRKPVVYEAVRTGALPSFRLGRRILIPRRAIAKLLGENN